MRVSTSSSIRSPRTAVAAVLAALLAITASASTASAQAALEMPQLSPRARVEQRVGMASLSIDYSSPAVKRRKIWGQVVPYEKLWRVGANAATKLTSSEDFSFGGVPVKAGAYSMFVIPAARGPWTVILNSDPTTLLDGYDPKKNVASAKVAPAALPAPRERMTFLFSDTEHDRTSLDLEWERVRIRVPITVDTKAHVAAAIDQATAGLWWPHASAATYYFEIGDLDRALALVDKSIAIQPTWYNEWQRAQILGKKGKKAEAAAAASRALTLGKGVRVFEYFFRDEIVKAIAGWK